MDTRDILESLFITSGLILGMLLGRVADAGYLTGDFQAQYYENLSNNPNPGWQFTPELEWHFDKQNTFSGDLPYRTTNDLQDATTRYTHEFTKHWSFYTEQFYPTSMASQNDSMIFGGSLNVVYKTNFGPLGVKLDNGIMGWDYLYDTQLDSPNDYNSAAALSDKLLLDYELFKGFKVVGSFHIYTFQDFNDETHTIYRDSFGLKYSPAKAVTFDFFYSYKNGDLNDIVSLEGGHYQLHAGMTLHF